MPLALPSIRLALLSAFTVFLIGGCSSTDPFGPTVEVSLDVRQPAALPSTLRIVVGTSNISLHADATSSAARTMMHVSGYGEQPVQVTLLGSQSEILATVSSSLHLQAGYQYGLGGMVSRVRPIGLCVSSIAALPLRNSPSDTLFVLYSALPKGAVC